MAHESGQQHPLSIYFWIWGLLFVLSFLSYMVDYLDFQGGLRWALILIFMFLKAGFIVAIFMHMAWERMALKVAILVPPVALLGGVSDKTVRKTVEWGEVLSLPTRGARIKARLHNPNGLAVIPHPGVQVRGVGGGKREMEGG